MATSSILLKCIGSLTCRTLILLTGSSLIGTSVSQERVVPPPQNAEIIPEGPRDVLKQTVIRKEKHSVTVRKVIPPSAVLMSEPLPSMTAPEDREKDLPRQFMMIKATSFDEKATLLEWWMGGEQFQAWSPANFQHLDGLVEFEAREFRYSIMCLGSKGAVPDGPISEMSKRSKVIVQGPTMEALGSQPLLVAGSEANGPSMDFLYGIHDHYNQNREQLAEDYEDKMLERRLNPPQPPATKLKKDATVTYWKYHKSSTNAKK